MKRLTSRIANAVRSRFTKDGVRDTGCTLKAMRRECVSALVPFKGMHRFIPALIKGAGYRLVEIPVNHRPRRFGQSKYGLGNRALRATDRHVRRALVAFAAIELQNSRVDVTNGTDATHFGPPKSRLSS